jgi:hypothetical protein
MMKTISSILETEHPRSRLSPKHHVHQHQQINQSRNLSDSSRTLTEAGQDQHKHPSRSAYHPPIPVNGKAIGYCSMLAQTDSKQKHHVHPHLNNLNLPNSCLAPNHLLPTAPFPDEDHQRGNYLLILPMHPTRDDHYHHIWPMCQKSQLRKQDVQHGVQVEIRVVKLLRMVADRNYLLSQQSLTIREHQINPPHSRDHLILQHARQGSEFLPTIIHRLLLRQLQHLPPISESPRQQKCILRQKRLDCVDKQKKRRDAQLRIEPGRRQRSSKLNSVQSRRSLKQIFQIRLPLPNPPSLPHHRILSLNAPKRKLRLRRPVHQHTPPLDLGWRSESSKR